MKDWMLFRGIKNDKLWAITLFCLAALIGGGLGAAVAFLILWIRG